MTLMNMNLNSQNTGLANNVMLNGSNTENNNSTNMDTLNLPPSMSSLNNEEIPNLPDLKDILSDDSMSHIEY